MMRRMREDTDEYLRDRPPAVAEAPVLCRLCKAFFTLPTAFLALPTAGSALPSICRFASPTNRSDTALARRISCLPAPKIPSLSILFPVPLGRDRRR